tara:strand:+ start:440 stop:559 length:120 start_codon:yes stop_codon:yes gene_type:complete
MDKRTVASAHENIAVLEKGVIAIKEATTSWDEAEEGAES